MGTKPTGRRWHYVAAWTARPGTTYYELWGPDATHLYDQVLLYSGPATSDENEIFSFDAPVAGFSVQACNSAGCSGFSSNVFPW